MNAVSPYEARRDRIETYFDRTASADWARMTSDAELSGVRARVRAGRERMRAVLGGWLPADLSGRRVLDAGSGTGMLAAELAGRGAEVVAVDLSPTLTALARERVPVALAGRIAFVCGDMLAPGLGRFDHVVSMDCLIHYRAPEAAAALASLASRTARSIVFTYAPRTPLLAAMHAAGRLFPRRDRSPSIEPVSRRRLAGAIGARAGLSEWRFARTARVSRPFYVSQALELVRS